MINAVSKFIYWFKMQKSATNLVIIFTVFLMLCCACGLCNSLLSFPASPKQPIETIPTVSGWITDIVTKTNITPTVDISSITPSPMHVYTLVPTNISISLTETPVLINGAVVVIKYVNKISEYVDLENTGNQPQDLLGWRIVSETGNQVCWLAGTIHPNETFRVWTNNSDNGGYNCGFSKNIWNNDESDPAILYNAQDIQVSKYP